jgi:phosphohistidine phosphatase
VDLLVVRHAIAEPRRRGRPDAERQLTGNGRRRFGRTVAALQALDWRMKRLYHSPWTRARQTAELIQPLTADLVATTALIGPPGRELLRLIARGPSPAGVVGHEPWLSALIALLTIGNADAGDAIELKKGAVAYLSGDLRSGGMRLRALIPPRVARRVTGD